MSDDRADLRSLYAAARAYVEWEAELSGFGVPTIVGTAAEARVTTAGVAPRALVGDPGASASATGTHATAARVTGTDASVTVPSPARDALVGGPVDPPASRSQDAEAPMRRATLAALPPAASAAALDPEARRLRLRQLEDEVRTCVRCELAKGRTQTVFARGNPDSPVVFIGEGPGQEEDRQGLPFVGPAGQLLDRMVAAMGFGRDDVYICNVVKCRPPGNRTPLPSEAGACAPFLLAQIEATHPRVLVALGRCAAENMGLVAGGSWRGRWGKFHGIDVMPTYHPAFLLRSPEFKRPVWEDLQKVMSRLKETG